MSDLPQFLRTQAWEHYEGIIQMGYKDSVEDLKLWKAADLIESLQAKVKELTADIALTKCPVCGSESATSNQIWINNRIGELQTKVEELTAALDGWKEAWVAFEEDEVDAFEPPEPSLKQEGL